MFSGIDFGRDTITDSVRSGDGGSDELILQDLRFRDLALTFKRDDLEIRVFDPGRTAVLAEIKINDQAVPLAGLERLRTVDGVINLRRGLTLTGSNLEDEISGTGAADVLTGLDGDDELSGGAGGDVYVFSGASFGRDRIVDSGRDADTGLDILRFDLAYGSLALTMAKADLRIRVLDEQRLNVLAEVLVEDQALLAGRIERLVARGRVFDLRSGLTLTGTATDDLIVGTAAADVLAGLGEDDLLRGAGGSDRFVFRGDRFGFDEIDDRSVVTADTDVVVTDLPMSRWFLNVQGRDLSLQLMDPKRDVVQSSITITGQFDRTGQIEVFRSAGRALDLTRGLPLQGSTQDDTIAGTAGDDVMTGLAGNDRLTGGTGNDTYVFSGASFGIDRLSDNATSGASLDRILLQDVPFSQLFLDPQANGDLLVKVFDRARLATLSAIVIDDQADQSSTVESLVVSGRTIPLNAGLTINASNGSDARIYGTVFGDTLNGLLGDDNLDAGRGDDTYVFSGSNWGRDLVGEPRSASNNGSDTLFLPDVNYSQLYVGLDAGSNLFVSLLNAERTASIASIQVLNQAAGGRMEFLHTRSGKTSLAQGLEIRATNGNDDTNDTSVRGTGFADSVNGLRGDDILLGGAGGDRYVFDGRDFGLDTVSDASGADSLVFSVPGETLFLSMSSNQVDLFVRLLNPSRTEVEAGVEVISQADPRFRAETMIAAGTVFDISAGLTMTASNVDDVVYGTAFGDRLNGLAGNDRLVGGAGDDTYTFAGAQFGADVVDERGGQNNGRDTIILPDADRSQVEITDEFGIFTITVSAEDAGIAGTIRLDGQESSSSAIETLQFADGSQLDLMTL